ncbi:MAG: hypothetical protein AAGD22_10020 [Verrucomicrobiota bacterium]
MISIDKRGTPVGEVPTEGGDDWSLDLRPYLWTANLKGDVGVQGLTVPVDVSFGDVLDNLDFAFAGEAELRYRRWGFFVDGNYIKMSPGIDEVPLGLFDTVGIEIKQVLLAMGVLYRVAEWDRGYLDLGAGAQYTSVDQTLNFVPDEGAIAAQSEVLAGEAVDRIAAQAMAEVRRITSAIPPPPMPVPPGVINGVDARVERGAGGATDRDIQETLEASLVSNVRGSFGSRVARSGPIREKIRELVQASVNEQIARVQSGVRSRAAARAARAREKAEENLAKALEEQITSEIPESAVVKEGWWDPFVAARVRHYLTDKVYVNAFGSVGGFGVSSDLIWQVGVGPGIEVNDWLAVEFFYRRMSIDYEDGGFVFDVDLDGLFLGLAIRL